MTVTVQPRRPAGTSVGGQYAETARGEPKVALDLPENLEPANRPWTIRLGGAELAATRERLARINERAERRGFTGRFEVTATPHEVTRHLADGVSVTETFYDTSITGQPPCYEGWTFLAAVDSTGDAVVLRRAPGAFEEDIDRDLLDGTRCDHCGAARRRSTTYVVRNEDGRTFQVGSTCVKDFTGWQGRPVFISDQDVADELFAGFGGGGFGDVPTRDVLGVSISAVKAFGFHRSGSETPTRWVVDEVIFGTSRRAEQLRRQLVPVSPEEVEEVVSTLLAAPGDSDYMENLHAVLSSERLNPKHLGILVSAYAAYQRMSGREAARDTRPARPDAWIGAVGQRLPVKGRVVKALTMDGYMPGTSSRLVVIDTDQGTVKSFTTAAWAWDVDDGDDVDLVGTVKSHGQYEGRKETVMTRLAINKSAAPPASGT